jgi:hypothetical protein
MSLFDIFNFRKRSKENQRLQQQKQQQIEKERLKREKETFNRKKDFIDEFIQTYKNEETIKRRAYQDKENERNKKYNKECPNCHSTNIIQVYRRNVGKINGKIRYSSSYSSSHSIFSGYSSFDSSTNGDLHGSLDTIRVNKCNKCGHEFEHKEYVCVSFDDYYYGKRHWEMGCQYLIEKVYDGICDLEDFNPQDLTEKCSTIEEKKESIINYIKECNLVHFDEIKDLPIEIIFYYASRNCRFYNEDEVFYYGKYKCDNKVQQYMGRFTDKVERFLIEELGFKYHF